MLFRSPFGIEVFTHDAGVQAVQRLRPLAELGIDLRQIEVRRNDWPPAATRPDQVRKLAGILVERVKAFMAVTDGGAADRGQVRLRAFSFVHELRHGLVVDTVNLRVVQIEAQSLVRRPVRVRHQRAERGRVAPEDHRERVGGLRAGVPVRPSLGAIEDDADYIAEFERLFGVSIAT